MSQETLSVWTADFQRAMLEIWRDWLQQPYQQFMEMAQQSISSEMSRLQVLYQYSLNRLGAFSKGAVLGIVTPFVLLLLLGFGLGGVREGSKAAGFQSFYYGGNTGGFFSKATSAGMAGFSKRTLVVLAFVGGVAGLYYF